MKDLHPGLLFLTFVAGIVILALSSVFTYIFFTTLTPGYLGILLGVFGVCNDIGKIAFLPATVLCVMANRKGSAAFFLCLWLGCFSISLVASQGFDLNQKTKIKNEALTTSDDYKRQQALFGTESSSIQDLKKSITSLRSSRDKEIKNSSANLKGQLENARRLDYITTPGIGVNAISEKIRKAESSTRSRIDSDIAIKERQLRQKEAGLNTIDKGFDKMSKNIDATEGLITFSNWLSSVSGQYPDKIIGWFYIFKNVFSEFLGLGLIMLSGLELKPTSPTSREMKEPSNKPGIFNRLKKFRPSMATIKSKVTPESQSGTKLQDHYPTPEVSNAIKVYASAVLKNPKSDRSCPGLTTIAKNTTLSRNDLLKAKSYLEEKKILTVQGTTTYVNDVNKLMRYT